MEDSSKNDSFKVAVYFIRDTFDRRYCTFLHHNLFFGYVIDTYESTDFLGNRADSFLIKFVGYLKGIQFQNNFKFMYPWILVQMLKLFLLAGIYYLRYSGYGSLFYLTIFVVFNYSET